MSSSPTLSQKLIYHLKKVQVSQMKTTLKAVPSLILRPKSLRRNHCLRTRACLQSGRISIIRFFSTLSMTLWMSSDHMGCEAHQLPGLARLVHLHIVIVRMQRRYCSKYGTKWSVFRRHLEVHLPTQSCSESIIFVDLLNKTSCKC